MYIDLIVQIKNAEQAGKPGLSVPFSKMDLAVSRVLVEAGYVSSVEKRTAGKKTFLDIKLAKRKNGEAVISGFKIISKPGRRVYLNCRNLRPVKQGYGIGIISTPSGVMSGREAKKKKAGGEYLLEVW